MVRSSPPSPSSPEFIAAYPFLIAASEHYGRHKHEFHELVVMQRGRLRVRLSGGERMASPGDILLYPAGLVHEEWAEDGDAVLTWVCMFRWDGLGANTPLFCRDVRGRVQELILKLTWESRIVHSPEAADPESCLTLLLAIIDEIQHLAAHEPRAMVGWVRAYIRANMNQPFSLDDLAAISGLSKGHFVRQYREITGRTPMEDARFLRVEEARRLILNTSLRLCEIAPLVGFSDENHLSHTIKVVLGVGVRELRRSGHQSPTQT